MNTIDVFGVPVSRACTLEQFKTDFNEALKAEQPLSVTFVNPHSVYNCEKNKSYRQSLDDFDRIYCDGIGMVIAAKRFGCELDRLSFDATSLSPVVFDKLSETKTKIFFVGGKDGVAQKAASVIKNQFPELNIIKSYSGYGREFEAAQINILTSGYSVVICGLGYLRQEEFIIKLHKEGWAGIGFTCGGYFDQVGEQNTYYPEWVDKYELRFLYRLFKEPKRLARRYFVEYMPFIRAYIKTYSRFR